MNFDIEWFSPNLGTPTVSLAEYGIVFNKAAIIALNTPHSIRIGFDRKNKCIIVLGVKESEVTEDCISFASKERNGYIRINNKDFVRFVLRYCPELRLDKAKRFLARKEGDFLVIDLNTPADSTDSTENLEA